MTTITALCAGASAGILLTLAVAVWLTRADRATIRCLREELRQAQAALRMVEHWQARAKLLASRERKLFGSGAVITIARRKP